MSVSFGIYALAPVRSSQAVFEFLDHFAPEREEMAHEYEIPWTDDNPIVVFEKDADLIAHCATHLTEPHSLSWRRIGSGDPGQVRVNFTSDQGMILSLVVSSQPEKWESELLAATGSQKSLIRTESQATPALQSDFLDQ
jgi:hypothetical protein